MNTVRKLLTVGLFSIICVSAFGQEKERGETDYTNNRTKDRAVKQKPNREKFSTSNRPTITKIIEYIPGVWQIERVYQGQKDITQTDSLAMSQSIEFNREGRYMSHTGSEQIDSGAYRINEQHAILYLASETNDKPSEWYVSFDDDGLMTMRMKDASKHGESFRYVYRRKSMPTTSNR